jgi:hypothetical protein
MQLLPQAKNSVWNFYPPAGPTWLFNVYKGLDNFYGKIFYIKIYLTTLKEVRKD